MEKGSEWVTETLKLPVSSLGRKVADVLGEVFCGLYHIEKQAKKVNWNDNYVIEINLQESWFNFGAGRILKLIVLCYDNKLRFSINAASPRYQKLYFHHEKENTNNPIKRPTLEEQITFIRYESMAYNRKD